MFTNMMEIELIAEDRAAVIVEGVITKVHVAGAEGGLVFVTTGKGAAPIAYNRSEVFPLYRGKGAEGVLFCNVPQFPKI